MASRALKVDPEKSEKKSASSEPLAESAQPAVSGSVDEREISEVAYQFWQERGCPIGSDQEDWLRAEEKLKNLPSAAHGW